MSLLDPADRSARGLAIEAEVMGQPPRKPATPLEASWRDFVFAEVWSRPGLDRKARFLVAMAGAAMAGASTGALDGYVRGALKSAALTLAELREVALHLAAYGGWSRGGELDRSITRVARDHGLPAADLPPIRAQAWEPQERTAAGVRTFIATMGSAPSGAATPCHEAVADFVFGEVWCRAGLDQRSRRWITLVCVSESGAVVPIGMHVHAAMASGDCQPGEMHEFVLQYAMHAGWPKAAVVEMAVTDMTRKIAAGLPWNG